MISRVLRNAQRSKIPFGFSGSKSKSPVAHYWEATLTYSSWTSMVVVSVRTRALQGQGRFLQELRSNIPKFAEWTL